MQIDQLRTFLKENGFVFQGSQIYGGIANSWDYGPMGVELKNNIKALWWKRFVQQDPNVEGLDSSLILSPKVWEASGHLDNFSDPLIDCKECKTRHRADKIIDEATGENVEGWEFAKIKDYMKKHNVVCPKCKEFNYTDIRNFNLMFKVDMSITGAKDNFSFLRPETAQGIFINFNNVAKAANQKLPFGIGQVGKSFRNEITPGNFIFRTKEFEQMELEFFFDPSKQEDWFVFFQNKMSNFLEEVGVKQSSLVIREHDKEELSHYSSKTLDFEFKYPFGQKELCGLAHRGNYDLSAHNAKAHEKLSIRDLETNQEIIPDVIEPSIGVERLMFATLLDSYEKTEEREVLKLPVLIAPIKVAILPLMKKLHADKAKEIYEQFATIANTKYLETGNIGKRYKKQDRVGTPFCITVDDETINNNTVTIRHRDSAQQETMTLVDAVKFIQGAIKY